MLSTKLDMIKVGVTSIRINANLILEDIRDFEGYDDLYSAEMLIDRIIREAEDTKQIIMAAYDELDD